MSGFIINILHFERPIFLKLKKSLTELGPTHVTPENRRVVTSQNVFLHENINQVKGTMPLTARL